MKILVVGSSGMLGSQLAKVFTEEFGTSTVHTTQRTSPTKKEQSTFSLDARNPDFSQLREERFDYVVNAIGVIKPYILEDDSESMLNAIEVNSVFPHLLSQWASSVGAKMIQIATDCVFSGQVGGYVESDPSDALDIYGKSKSLGEVHAPNVMNIRASIIGREESHFNSLVSWVQGQKLNASITGYTDHLWNGVTTYAFSRICAGIIAASSFKAGTYHLVPSSSVDKDTLVRLIAQRLGRQDISVSSGTSGRPVNMTLSTNWPQVNAQLWRDGGFAEIPSVNDLVANL